MYQIYLWKYNRMPSEMAMKIFEDIISSYACNYGAAFGVEPEVNIINLGEVFVAQIYYLDRVLDWEHSCCGSSGSIIWGGVCEKYLGITNSQAKTNTILDTVSNNPKEIINWDGRFVLISKAANSDNIHITTSATESPSLWSTSGPNGWAMGSRATPLLNLVGCDKELDSVSTNLFLGFGFLPNNTSHYKGVDRVNSRTQIIIPKVGSPKFTEYCSLAEYFTLGSASRSGEAALEHLSSKITQRVALQIKHSKAPRVLLTGGRDSRCLAAAAWKSGYRGSVSTGGFRESKDFQLAKKIAQTMNLGHKYSGGPASVQLFRESNQSLHTWSDLSEGIETIRHARSYPDFFRKALPVSENGLQYFHGLGGEILRGYYYQQPSKYRLVSNNDDLKLAHQIILDSWPKQIKLSGDARDTLFSIFEKLDYEVRSLNGGVAQWLDLFYWQYRVLHWGEDLVSVKSPIFWSWTPLLDRELIKQVFMLSPGEKRHSKQIEELTLKLAPALSHIEYDTKIYDEDLQENQKNQYRRRLKRHIKHILKPIKNIIDNHSGGQITAETGLWDDILFDHGSLLNNYMSDRRRRLLVKTAPQSELLWNMATVALLENLSADSNIS